MKAISKKLLSLLVVVAMVLSMVPFGGLGIFAVETKAAATAAADEIVAAGNAIAATANAMTFTGGEDTKTCPVCNKEVTWKPIENGENIGSAEGHFYLAENVTFTKAEYFATAATTGTKMLCLHLNGKDLDTAWGIRVSESNTTINIMGSGNVSSTGGDTNTYGTTPYTQDATLKTTIAAAHLNIYGGTYTSEAGVVLFMRQSSDVSIYGDTVIDGNNAVRSILMYRGTLNINGGTIQNGYSTGAGGNIRAYGDHADANKINIVMNGGTIKDGSGSSGGSIYVAGDTDTNRAVITINGGTIGGSKKNQGIRINDNQVDVIINGGNIGSNANDTVHFNDAGATLTMSGTPTVAGGGISLKDATQLITDAGLSTGASVAIANVNRVFAIYDDAAAAEAAKGYFKAADSDYEVVVDGTSLKLAEKPAVEDDGIFDPAENDGQEYCPVCGTLETWTAVEGNKRVANAGTGHYYLSGDVNYTSATAEMFASVAEGGKICFHLNSHNVVSVPGIIADAANSTLNIMGEGTIKSDANPVISCANKTAVINIEAGVVVDGDNANHRVIDVNPGTVNLNGCTIQNGKYTDGQGGNIRVNGGGTLVVNEGTLITGGGDGTKQGGNIYVLGTSATNRGTLIINGGTIENGQASAEVGDEVRVNTHADVTINGGTINGEVSYANATATESTKSTLTMSGVPVITGMGLRLPDGVIITDNGLTTGASVAVYNAEQVFATYDDVAAAAAAKDYFTSARSAYGVSVNDCSLYLSCYAVVNADDGSITWCALDEALNEVNGATTKYLKAGADVALNGETVYIDPLRSINVIGTGTVYGIDPDNKDFETSTGKITADGPALKADATFDGTLYIKIADGSFHAIELGITSVTLRPTAIGLYYKATYKCDAKLAEVITAYGVVLSVKDMPGANFVEEATNQFTVQEAFKEKYDATTHAVSATSGSVFGIMKDGVDNNQERGEMKIYANAYIEVNGELIYVGDTKNANKKVTDDDFTGVALSLFDVMDKVDNQWDSLNLTETNIEQINALYDKCKEFGVNWTFNNITGTNV